MELKCFKAYDIRGRVGETLDPVIAWHIGRAYASVLSAKTVIIGQDARKSSPAIAAALASGLAAGGARVRDIGLCGTEEVYFATGHTGADGGIMVTASHNPIDYNGMKLVGPESRPIDPATELAEIRALAEASLAGGQSPGGGASDPHPLDTRQDYAARVCDFVDASELSPLRVVLNPGNGTAGLAADAIVTELARRGGQFDAIRVNYLPDPTFPNGIPNPLLAENRASTASEVVRSGADLGIAWDGDFDRCFFFDSEGGFLDGEYAVALLAASFLETEPGATIVHDPRVIWATTTTVSERGGTAVAAPTGHAFLKQAMRRSGAIYGGEMSAHHYFRDFYFCDSGMIPWLKVAEYMSRTGASLADLVGDLRRKFPSSGEINFVVDDPQATIRRVLEAFGGDAVSIDRIDGAGLDFGGWRMNLRASNTEPLLRLNVETRGDRALLEDRVQALSAFIAG